MKKLLINDCIQGCLIRQRLTDQGMDLFSVLCEPKLSASRVQSAMDNFGILLRRRVYKRNPNFNLTTFTVGQCQSHIYVCQHWRCTLGHKVASLAVDQLAHLNSNSAKFWAQAYRLLLWSPVMYISMHKVAVCLFTVQ